MFSFYLSKTTCNFILGGYDLTYAADGEDSEIYWQDLSSSTYWGVNLQSVSLGSQYPVDIKVSQAIVDTGTSYLLIPTSDFNSFMAYFTQTMVCAYD